MIKNSTVSYPDTLEAVTHLSSADFQARARTTMAVNLYELNGRGPSAPDRWGIPAPGFRRR